MHITRFPKRPAFHAAVLAGSLLSGLALSGCSKDEDPTGPAGDPDAKIIISSPAAGATYHVGDSLRIQWTYKQDPVDPMDGFNISLSPDSGAHWASLLTNAINPDLGKFAWKIADDSIYIQTLDAKLPLAGSSKCMVRVEQYGTGDPHKKILSRTFTIAP